MKSSSLGARLFEGLVQPILGSLWTSPPATVENSGDRSNTGSGKQTHAQRSVSRDQPNSGYAGAPAMRSTVHQQRHGSCGNDATRTATAGGILNVKRPQSVPRRSLNSAVRLANAATFSEPHATYVGTPPAAERASHKRQKRVLQRQAFCRPKEEGQRTIKGTNDSLAARIVMSGHGRTRGNNSGPGNCALTVRSGLRSCKTCKSGKDCSSSSSWGGDDCAFPSGNSSLLLSGSMNHMALQRSGQAWSTIRAQPGEEPPEKQLQLPSKQLSGQMQREDGAFRYAVCSEESSSEAELHSCKSAAPACVTVGNSCSAGPPCRLQCSDTTTTCSGSSMTNRGDSRDTATGSAAMALEQQQQYLDIEEQMPPTFPTSPAEEPPRTLCSTRAAFPYAQNDGSISFPSSLECASVASSFPRIDATVQTSSNPPAPMTLTSSIFMTGESVQHKRKGCGLTSHSSLLQHTQQDQEVAESAGDASNMRRVRYALIPSTSGRQPQQLHLQNSAASAAAASQDTAINISVAAGHRGDCSKAQATTEACAADNETHPEQEEQHQQRRSEGVTPASVVFGHRVLKPLRSKCLEENYDALVEIVAFTKRRCERETMELLRKDAHILYYARGLHHAAHVETYLRQQQSQQEKQQQGSANVLHNEGTTGTCSATSLNISSTRSVPQAASESAPPAASSTMDVPSTDKRNPAAPCFPSVSAALAGGARPQAVPDWATPEALREALERQQCYDPFSIFGEAPPELLLSEVYDEQHYTHISPQTRASHPVLARLKHQRSAALMAVFQQKCAGLLRTQQLLEHELRQLQRHQRTNSSPQQVALEHGSVSSVLGQALFSCNNGTAAATMKTVVSGEDGGGLPSLPLKKLESEEDPETKNNRDKETMLRLQHREVLLQRQLLERRLEEQLQQEERIHGELLRNGFRFLGGRVNGAEKGAVLFRKWVLPALESWWQQQCQVELDWRNDPLTSEECSWYREVMNAAVDASDLISVQQACFCPTPPPYRQWAWTDCRVRQRQQHEQKLAKLREQQVRQQQQLTEEREGSPAAVDWISGESAEYNEAEEAGEADVSAVSEDESRATGCDAFPSLQEDAAEEAPHVGERSCAHSSVAGSVARKQNEQLISRRTASRKSRKRRAKGDGTPQGYGSNVEAPGSDIETAAASNSGSARKRPRGFCRQVKNIHFQQAQTERSQKLQIALECSSGHCACGSRILRKENVAKHHVCPTSGAKRGTLVPASGFLAAPEADKSCHRTGNVRSAGASAATRWQQPLSLLNEHTNSDENSGDAMASAGTCILAARGNGKDVLSPCRGRQADHTFSTPVAKMQALKLSKQQRFISTVPVRQVQPRERAADKGQQQHTRPAPFGPSNKTAGLHRGASPGDQPVVPPSPATTTMKTPAYHLISSWTGSSDPGAALRSEWDRKAATAEAAGTSAAASGAGYCGSGLGDGRSNVGAREAFDASFSTSTDEARCQATKSLKQLETSAAQRRPRQLQRRGIRSSRAVQESCLSVCKPGLGVQVTPSTGIHSRVAAAAVREVAAGKVGLAEPTSSGFMRKGMRSGDNPTSKNMYLPGGGNVRATTLQAIRGARLSIDRVYGCRRTRTIRTAEPVPNFF